MSSESWALASLRAAVERIEAASEPDSDEAQAAVHDALTWACKLDEFLGRSDEPLMWGLRYARDRALHQMARTGRPAVVTTGPVGRKTVVQFNGSGEPLGFLTWRPRDEMPLPGPQHDDPRKASAYDEHLSGEVVVVTFFEAEELLSR